MRESGADRHRHAAQHTRARRSRRIAVTVRVEPDQANARGGTVGRLQPAQHAGAMRAIATGQHNPGARPARRRNRFGNRAANQAQVIWLHCATQVLGEHDFVIRSWHPRLLIDMRAGVGIQSALVAHGGAAPAIPDTREM